MKSYNCFTILFCCLLLLACERDDKSYFAGLVQEWLGKSIKFPNSRFFAIQGKDTVNIDISGKYKVLTYVDTTGCISCYLQLEHWKNFMEMEEMDSVKFLFFFPSEKRQDILNILEEVDFSYPICVDEHNSLDSLNRFPVEFGGQTFLLDKENRVLAIGNPIHNRKVKELYLKIIQGKPLQDRDDKKRRHTTVSLDTTTLSLGKFPWQEEKQATFRLKNTGDELLVIHDVVTSCGCLQVDYSKEPVRPGKEAVLRLTYKADHAGYVSKTVLVYCNAEGSPLKFWVRGEAE